MAGCIHTINETDKETDKITYTTPDPYIIQLKEEDTLTTFAVTSCIRDSLIYS